MHYVVAHKTQVSPYSIKSDLKYHKSDSCVDPKRFCEVEQQAEPSMGAGLAKNGSKSEFQSYPDPNPDLPRSNPERPGSHPVSTPNPDPNPVLTPNLGPNSIPNPNPIFDQLFPNPSLNLDLVSIRNSPNFQISQHTRGFD